MMDISIHILFIFTFLIKFCYNQNLDKEIVPDNSNQNKLKNSDTPIEIAAVGRVAKLGDLYDARTDQFLHLSLFKSKLTNTSIISRQNSATKLEYTLLNTYEEKFRTLDISAELKISILGGLFELEGSGRFFKDTKRSARSAKASLIHSLLTVYEEISITEDNIRPSIDFDVLEHIDATHVVVAIQWGGRVFISVEDSNFEEKDIQTIEGKMKAQMKKLTGLIEVSGNASVNISENEKNEMSRFNFEIFGDILPDDVPQSLIEAIKFMKSVPSLLKKANGGKGKAMKYSLISVSLLRKLWKVNVSKNSFVERINEETVKKCVALFDDMNLIEQKVNDLNADISEMEPYMETNKVEKIKELQLKYNLYQASVRRNFSEHLIIVRSGNETVNKLEEIVLKSSDDPYSPRHINSKLKQEFGKLKQEISFIRLMMKMNVTMLNKNTRLQQFLWENFNNDVYILFYNYEYENDVDKAMNTFRKMLENKQEFGPRALFVAVDYEILNENKNLLFLNLRLKPKISLYRNGTLSIENYQIGFKPENDTNPQLWSLYQMQQQLARIIKNPVPIGFIYVQLPNEDSPTDIWPSLIWEDVSSRYQGLFFRVTGGEAASFGQVQEDNSPHLIAIENGKFNSDGQVDNVTEAWSGWLYSGDGSVSESRDTYNLSLALSTGEVRPRNMAIRVWKRTG